MNTLVVRSKRTAVQIARWYASPSGIVSATAIVAALGAATAGFPGVAVWILAIWLGAFVPYKLSRERAERSRQAAALSDRAEIATSRLAERTRTDLSRVARVEAVTALQREVDQRAVEADSQAAALEKMSEQLELQRQAAVEMKNELASIGRDLAARTKSLEARTERRITSELPALVALYRLLDAADPLPSFASWALSPEAALVLVETIFEADAELVVEAGSGSSTVVAALAMAKLGRGRVVALEHDAVFGELTRKELRRLGVEEYADVVIAPLVEHVVDGEPYPWYSLDSLQFDRPIDVLLVDGPPGATGPLARYPAVPVMADSLVDGAVIVLDDVDRDEEQQIAERWSQEFGVTLSTDVAGGELGVGRFVRKTGTTS